MIRSTIRSTLLVCSAVLGTALSLSPVSAALTIDVSYTGPAQFQSFFDDAATTWENLLVGYQDGQIQAVSSGSSYIGQPFGTPLTSVFIEANLTSIDGVGGVLGSAGPSEVAVDGAGFVLTTDGSMNFDDADAQNLVNQNTFGFVVLHEMAHVLGFGTLWTNNNVYNNGTGEFTGVNATAAWQNEFGQSGTPDVELAGGPGTANGHWDEVDLDQPNGLSPLQPTGITDAMGNDLRDELMTGFLTAPFTPEVFISQMTVNSFIDIGFIGSSIAAIPETGSFLSFGLIFGRLATTRRREHAA